MDNTNKTLQDNVFSQSRLPDKTALLSELVWEVATSGKRQEKQWRETHVIDGMMRTKFGKAADAIARCNRVHHRGSYRLNVMLTVNIWQVAICLNIHPLEVKRCFLQNMKNLFRNWPHDFMCIWRHEGRHGDHIHLLIHAPRLMRAILLERLPVWCSDPLDACRTSRRFDRRIWQACGTRNSWHMCRVYDVGGILDYLAKVPLGPNGKPRKRYHLDKGVREFGIVGI